MGAGSSFPFEEWFKGKTDDDLFSTTDISRLLRMTPRSVCSLIARGRLEAYPLEGVWRIKARAFRAYLVSICQRRNVHKHPGKIGTKRAEESEE
jgi:hypothetical protein